MQFEVPATPAGLVLTVAVLCCSLGAAVGLLLHDAMGPALSALLMALVAGHWRPRNHAQTLFLGPDGVCRWSDATGNHQGTLASAFVAGDTLILRLASPVAACTVMLLAGALPAPLRCSAGRWLNATGRG